MSVFSEKKMKHYNQCQKNAKKRKAALSVVTMTVSTKQKRYKLLQPYLVYIRGVSEFRNLSLGLCTTTHGTAKIICWFCQDKQRFQVSTCQFFQLKLYVWATPMQCAVNERVARVIGEAIITPQLQNFETSFDGSSRSFRTFLFARRQYEVATLRRVRLCVYDGAQN